MAGAREKANFRGTSLETLKHMVSSGNGVTLIPRLAILKTDPDNAQVRYLPFETGSFASNWADLPQKFAARKLF